MLSGLKEKLFGDREQPQALIHSDFNKTENQAFWGNEAYRKLRRTVAKIEFGFTELTVLDGFPYPGKVGYYNPEYDEDKPKFPEGTEYIGFAYLSNNDQLGSARDWFRDKIDSGNVFLARIYTDLNPSGTHKGPPEERILPSSN